jgi:hypothetical protein
MSKDDERTTGRFNKEGKKTSKRTLILQKHQAGPERIGGEMFRENCQEKGDPRVSGLWRRCG